MQVASDSKLSRFLAYNSAEYKRLHSQIVSEAVTPLYYIVRYPAEKCPTKTTVSNHVPPPCKEKRPLKLELIRSQT